MGEIILQKDFKSLEHKEKLIKATNRFIKYLNNKNTNESAEYIFSINSQRVGKYYLSFSTRNADVKNLKERRTTLQNKLRSYKAQITRTKNKIDVIIKNYNGTLFSEQYKTDKKYIKLLDKLQDKTLNYKNMKSNLKHHDIEITSLFEPSSFNSLKKILKKDDLYKEFGEDIQIIMNEIKAQQINTRTLLIEHFGRA
jgi:predicted RNase H-like nuclease (RuvC/YqgF family)